MKTLVLFCLILFCTLHSSHYAQTTVSVDEKVSSSKVLPHVDRECPIVAPCPLPRPCSPPICHCHCTPCSYHGPFHARKNDDIVKVSKDLRS